MSKFINLISDTVTKPSPEMLKVMFEAEVGDDVFNEDPTVNRLQQMAADMFGMEAALFCPSGTQTNQIAIAAHTSRMDEVICHEYSHIYQYETGGYAYNSGVGIKLLKGENGILNIEDVKTAINPTYDWLANSSLLVLENTSNKGGGSYYTIEQVKEFSQLSKEKGLKFHLDGARLFNALVETGESTQDYGPLFDSISICLSKGLGAPIGSLLLGKADFIKKSRRLRKVMGGGMRQAGYLAAAGIYALENNVERLKIDNDRAKDLGKTLETLNYVESVRPIQTNILIFDLKKPIMATPFLEKLKEKGINASPFGPSTIRFVTHLDITEEMIERTKEILKDLEKWDF
jgi:threonine aldolase